MNARRPGPPTPAIVIFAAAVQVTGTVAAARHDGELRSLTGVALIILLAGPALLSLRRSAPGPMVAGIAALDVAYLVGGYPLGPFTVSLAFALILAGLARARWWVWSTVATLIMLLFIFGAVGIRELNLAYATGATAWLAVFGLVGEGLRMRADRVLERRNAQAAEARRREDETRLALARDIHDVVAHSLSMINVQASVALHLADHNPDQLKPALEAIKAASKNALTEVRQVLGVLRDDAPRAPVETRWPPVRPQPTLEQLPALVQEARRSGLGITLDPDVPADLGFAVQAVAYRTVQEALTNVVRHAGAQHAVVSLSVADGQLRVSVSDDGAGLRGAEPGIGLRGMRERVGELGGTLSVADIPPGGVCVEARISVQAVGP